ncbi:hypothetical protein [Ectobacillus ponti]|uniref:DUF58 domain-containing protein n=1 Tax=Ectobacillus ponti TaxID=2961894 RepID=A0AA41X4L9_9BACI|nr:hypothetical protein [Ectobacillus ponti]MCP8968632.1 hypothetical protein [Ectobacillus ponti]
MRGERLVTAPIWLQKQTVLLTLPLFLLCYLFLPPYKPLLLIMLLYYFFAIGVHQFGRLSERQLSLDSEDDCIRLFPEEAGTLSLSLHNAGWLPLANGKCLFRIHPALEVAGAARLHTFSFHMPPRSRLSHTVAFTAKRRGVYQFQQVELIAGEPFGLLEVHLPSVPRLATEVMVYPAIQPVSGLDFVYTSYGTDASRKSFWQPTSRSGTAPQAVPLRYISS